MIYLDNNATTQVAPEVLNEMLPFWRDHFANPSSPYTFARRSALAVARAREQVAEELGAEPAQVTFTSGGSESINSAFYAATHLQPERKQVVISTVEHAATLACADRLEQAGYRVVRVPVDSTGQLDRDLYNQALTADTALVSLMAANNETGVRFPIEELAAAAEDKGILFHCDATQMLGKESFRVDVPGISWVSISAHKSHGPKGVGASIVRQPDMKAALIVGGDQEHSRRAGTENVAGIVGFGAAISLIPAALPVMNEQIRNLRDYFEREIQEKLPAARIIGMESPRLPNTSFFCIPGIPSEILIARLDMAGVCCSAGSACASGATEPSHVLRAMKIPDEIAIGAVRISLSRYTKDAEVQSCVAALVAATNQGA